MTKAQIDRLQILLGDDFTVACLRALFAEVLDEEKPDVFGTDSDEVIGQRYRAYHTSKRILEKTIIKLESYQTQNNPQSLSNLAR